MNLEDYMNKAREKNNIPGWAHFYYNLDNYNINSKKLELLNSMKKYIKTFTHCADIDYYLSNLETLAQIKTTDGDSMLVKIDIMKEIYINGEYQSSYKISEEEYNKRLNTYQRIGSQKISWIYITMPFTDNRSITLYYTFDGKYFIDKENIENLNMADTEDFAKDLANMALQSEENNFDREKWINDSLQRNHKFNKIDNYTFHDDGLYLNNQLVKKIH